MGSPPVKSIEAEDLFEPEDGVGVETEAKNGSPCKLEDDVERRRTGVLADAVTDNDEVDGRSSRAGGTIPSSVYRKSICTSISESWASRLPYDTIMI